MGWGRKDSEARFHEGGESIGPFNSLALANRILDHADDNDIELTVMQLVVLVYIAHGWWLSFSEGRPLTKDKPEMWTYGPIYRDVYYAFRDFAHRPITGRATHPISGEEYREDWSEQEQVDWFLERIVVEYGKYYAFELSGMLDDQNAPWSIPFEQSSNYNIRIPNDVIRKQFDDFRRRGIAQEEHSTHGVTAG